MFKMWIETGYLFLILCAIVLGNKKCNPSNITNEQCLPSETCDESSNSCQCLPEYERKNEKCILKLYSTTDSTPNYSSLVDNQGSGSIVAGILIPLFMIVFVMCGLYVTRKYKLIAWVRSKLNRRNENYDEFMIGQDLDDDDPPLR